MMERVDLIVMNGRSGSGAAERMVDGARQAITLDLIDRALSIGEFASIIVGTNDPVLAETLEGWPTVIVAPDPGDEPFHFGRRLQRLIGDYRVERAVYMGGGSAPLLSAAVMREMAERLRATDRLLLANNYYSVDFCAFTPASALLSLRPPANDNALGWLLGREAGLPAHELPRTPGTVFDVDTPIDLMTLALHPDVPPRTRRYLDGLELDTRRLRTAAAVLISRQAEAMIAGRISSQTMAYLQRETLCRKRIYSEERGMRSDGRIERGEVRSLLGLHIESVGLERFFGEVVPELGQAAFIDDRVVWAHHDTWPKAADRFNSDLMLPELIDEPFVRRFTEAARSCSVPVVLGGHSLVSGGLYVLVEAAWARSGRDVQRAVTIG